MHLNWFFEIPAILASRRLEETPIFTVNLSSLILSFSAMGERHRLTVAAASPYR